MQEIGSKLIHIKVVDNSPPDGLIKDDTPLSGLTLTSPETGGFFDGGLLNSFINNLTDTPVLSIILTALAAFMLMSIVAVVLHYLRHNDIRDLKLTKFIKSGIKNISPKASLTLAPVAIALAIIATPIINTLASSNNPIDIIVDKGTATSKSDTAVATLSEDANSHANVYMELTDFDASFEEYYGEDIIVNANDSLDPNTNIELSTNRDLVYTTGPISAGDTSDFNITASVTDNLPVGEYNAKVTIYGEYFNKEPKTLNVEKTVNNVNPGVYNHTFDENTVFTFEVRIEEKAECVEEYGVKCIENDLNKNYNVYETFILKDGESKDVVIDDIRGMGDIEVVEVDANGENISSCSTPASDIDDEFCLASRNQTGDNWTFTNNYNYQASPGTITIDKELYIANNGEGRDSSEPFEFLISLIDKDGNSLKDGAVTYNVDGGNETNVTSGTITEYITLDGVETEGAVTINLSDVADIDHITIVEQSTADDYYIDIGNSGEISFEEGAISFEAKNTFYPKEARTINIKKVVNNTYTGPYSHTFDPDKEFNFEIQVAKYAECIEQYGITCFNTTDDYKKYGDTINVKPSTDLLDRPVPVTIPDTRGMGEITVKEVGVDGATIRECGALPGPDDRYCLASTEQGDGTWMFTNNYNYQATPGTITINKELDVKNNNSRRDSSEPFKFIIDLIDYEGDPLKDNTTTYSTDDSETEIAVEDGQIVVYVTLDGVETTGSVAVNLSDITDIDYATIVEEDADPNDYYSIDFTNDGAELEFDGENSIYFNAKNTFDIPQVEVTFWCRAGWGEEDGNTSVLRLEDGEGLYLYEDNGWVSKTIIFYDGDDFTTVVPNDLGMNGGDCDYVDDEYMRWEASNKPEGSSWSASFTGTTDMYWPSTVLYLSPGNTTKLLKTPLVEPFSAADNLAPVPTPDSSEPWYDCYIGIIENGFVDATNCRQYIDDMYDWMYSEGALRSWSYNIYWDWIYSSEGNTYSENLDAWESTWWGSMDSYYNNNNAWPMFDGMNLYWQFYGDLG